MDETRTKSTQRHLGPRVQTMAELCNILDAKATCQRAARLAGMAFFTPMSEIGHFFQETA